MAKFFKIVHFMILLISVFFIERNICINVECETDEFCQETFPNINKSHIVKCIDNLCRFLGKKEVGVNT
uniref:Nodule-specific cysteine-rich peptide L06 n=1 Tax=Lens culinaris TaxID=3864 RepID=A0A7T8DVA5_LENCU|nr:nodule-specific cysteine-rich peptide L06 [Lens culinaris]